MLDLVWPLAGTALGVVRSLRVRRYAVDVQAYERAVHTILADGSLDRLSKLDRAARPLIYPAAIEAARECVLASAPDYPEALARAAASEAFVKKHEAELQRFRWSPFVDLIQLGLGPGTVGFTLWREHAVSVGTLAAALVALFLAVDVQAKRARIRRTDAGHAAPMLDAIVAARDKQSTDPYRSAPTDPPAGAARYLAVRRDGVQLSTFALTQPIVKIGCALNSDVVLDDDGVARMHAVLEDADGVLTLIDLGNVTLVNGVRVSKQVLSAGDRVGIGRFEIVVVDTTAAAVGAPATATLSDPERGCDACGASGFAPLIDAPESVVPPGYRGEHCRNCGKVEVFKILDQAHVLT